MAADAATSVPLDCSGAEPNEPVGLGVVSPPPDGVTTTTAVLVASGEPGMVCTVVLREGGVLLWSSSVVVVTVEMEMLMELLLSLEEEEEDAEADVRLKLVVLDVDAVGLDDDDGAEDRGVVVPLVNRLSVMAVAAAAAPAA